MEDSVRTVSVTLQYCWLETGELGKDPDEMPQGAKYSSSFGSVCKDKKHFLGLKKSIILKSRLAPPKMYNGTTELK